MDEFALHAFDVVLVLCHLLIRLFLPPCLDFYNVHIILRNDCLILFPMYLSFCWWSPPAMTNAHPAVAVGNVSRVGDAPMGTERPFWAPS